MKRGHSRSTRKGKSKAPLLGNTQLEHGIEISSRMCNKVVENIPPTPLQCESAESTATLLEKNTDPRISGGRAKVGVPLPSYETSRASRFMNKLFKLMLLLLVLLGTSGAGPTLLFSIYSSLSGVKPLSSGDVAACKQLANASTNGNHFAKEINWLQFSDKSARREWIHAIHISKDNFRFLREPLETLAKCCGTSLISSREPLASVELLRNFLEIPIKRNGNTKKCFVYLLELEHITPGPTAHGLKELLESNMLRSELVIPPPSRALVIILSRKSKNELKGVLPHRVVHFLNFL